MSDRCVLLTGFGAFEEVSENPSGALARRLDGETSGPWRVVGSVLPVSFERAPRELEALVERHRPQAIVATGVHPGAGFRLERRAGAGLRPGRPDADGVDAAELAPQPGSGPDPWLATGLDLERLAAALRAPGQAGVELSQDAGGYVCECVYRRVLELGAARGTHGLFVHVPPLEHLSLTHQGTALRVLLEELSLQIAAS